MDPMSRVYDLRSAFKEHERLRSIGQSRTFYPVRGLPRDVSWGDPDAVAGWFDFGPSARNVLGIYGRDGLYFLMFADGDWYVAIARWSLLQPEAA
jgi:hypothetical protein